MTNVFLVALSFDFAVEADPDAKFDTNGDPIAPTPTQAIGVGLLNDKTRFFASPA